jgi:hypothetical protein
MIPWLATAMIAGSCITTHAAGVFVIEAEDFNHGAGQHVAAADQMPYYGGAYQGLGAVYGVDYYRVLPPAEIGPNEYRLGEEPNVGVGVNADMDRTDWMVTSNWRIGWRGVGDWYNYTRVFPTGDYAISVALSGPSHQGTLQRVVSGATTATQTLEELGVFSGTESSGWGNNRLVPLKWPNGETATVHLEGVTTLRYTSQSGDIDYFRLESTTPPAPEPVIVRHPVSTNVFEGAPVSLWVVAISSLPLSYQWRHGGTNLPATSSLLSIANAQAEHAGDYDVIVSTSAGSVTSVVATLTLTPPPPPEPVIVEQPVSTNVFEGAPVSLRVVAISSLPLSYQWRHGGTNLPATSSLFHIANAQAEHAGDYDVIVSTSAGSVTSVVASLTFKPRPMFDVAADWSTTTNPNGAWSYYVQGQLATPYERGGEAWNGPAPVVWSVEGVPLHTGWSVYTGSEPGFLDVRPGEVYGYIYGWNVGSSEIVWTSPSAGSILVSGSLWCVRTGGSALNTLWSVTVGSSSIAQGTVDSSNLRANDRAIYFSSEPLAVAAGEVLTFKNWGETADYVGLRLTVDFASSAAPEPVIVRQPVSTNVVEGAPASLRVQAVSSLPLSYQWRHEGTNVFAVSNLLSFASVQVEHAGGYDVIVSTSSGAVTSAVARITVYPPLSAPTIIRHPTNTLILDGGSGQLTVEAVGADPLNYQWHFNGMDVPSNRPQDWIPLGPTLRIPRMTNSLAGTYDVTVHNQGGSVTSQAATLGVAYPPKITRQPGGTNASQGGSFTLTAEVGGTPPLVYQWRLRDLPIPGATSSSYTVLNAQTSHAGPYTLLLSSAYGSVTSQVAQVNVLAPPSITVEPQGLTVWAGTNTSLRVTAASTLPLSYQWRLNGTNVVGATNATLTLTNVRADQAGDYTVVVRNSVGAVTSTVAHLTVLSDAMRVLRLVGTNALAGGTVMIPVELAALGNENAVAFSVGFDTNFLSFSACAPGSSAGNAMLNLNTNQAGAGRVGFMLALPAGEAFVLGTQELVQLSFQVALGVGDLSVPITFGNQPLAREVTDLDANVLPATYVNGTISVDAGFEGDVTPLPYGNGLVTITDWVKVGRYAAGLDELPSASQFQKADCAPRSTLGNGAIALSDWVQVGRYAAGLDPLVTLGGPIGPAKMVRAASVAVPSAVAQISRPASVRAKAGEREVRMVGASGFPGQTNALVVQMVCEGNENALGFSLSFDVPELEYRGTVLGLGLSGGTLNVNTNQLADGRLGLALTLPIGTTFARGTQELVRVCFVLQPGAVGDLALSFGDQPVLREISDVQANAVSASYHGSMLTVLTGSPTALRLVSPQVSPDGTLRLEMINADGSGVATGRLAAIQLLTSTNVALDRAQWAPVTNELVLTSGVVRVEGFLGTNSPERYFRAVEGP